MSNIITSEYDTNQGEIQRGRAFGTPGEWKAAEIIAENMTKLGCYLDICFYDEGTYYLKVLAQDVYGLSSSFSFAKKVVISKPNTNPSVPRRPEGNIL